MFHILLKKIFGSRNDRLLKQFRAQVEKINALEPAMQALSEDELRGKTQEFRERMAQGATVDDLLVEAFAVVREGGRRVLQMRHFDVQLIGGMVLHSGRIAEMRTGEGKTLVATLAAYLNALSGKGVHVVTVNDYLAARDAEWMGKLYNYLGLSVGVIVSEPSQSTEEKQQAYQADITYGTNSEFGFDYLRDNLVYRKEDRSQQKGVHFAIIDEVDSILIDEARTPLIISGQVDGDTFMYNQTNAIAPLLTRMAHEPKKDQPEPEGDFWVDEKHRQLHLSDAGHERAENLLREQGLLQADDRLYDPKNIFLMHHLMASLRAHNLFLEGRDYFVRNGQVMIVDEFTGRPMEGRRWSDGLHQAIEAKEGVRIQPENQSLASITYQNYFRMYEKLSGMTGTADTEAAEFLDIYKLETVIMPTNRPAVRIDQNDQIYKTEFEKFQAIIEDIQHSNARQQPVLVGTTSIENSEKLSSLLRKLGLKHEVLNAKQHEREAQIVAEAGVPGRITIATNMAGRGTDIILGGNLEKMIKHIEESTEFGSEEKLQKIEAIKNGWQAQNQLVKQAGGLRIIGTERHESRRIDNQLRGRAGRQGDPGSSRFYLSLEDPIMIRMAGEKIRVIMERLKLPDHEPIEAGIMTRQIESAQKRMEGMNYEYRKQLLEYDDVANRQRKVLYVQRNQILEADNLEDIFVEKLKDAVEFRVRHFIPDDSVPEQWDVVGFEKELQEHWQLPIDLQTLVEQKENITDEDVFDVVVEQSLAQYHAKREKVHPELWQDFMRRTMLIIIDIDWRNQLSALEHLRRGIHLRAYAQKNPKQEYQREAFLLFGMMLENIDITVTQKVLGVEVPENPYQGEDFSHADQVAYGDNQIQPDNTELQLAEIEDYENTGRNQPCPCGSGKKFKHCHGKIDKGNA